MRNTVFLFFAAVSALTAAQAHGQVLTFEGVGNQATIGDFYNGGTDSAGNSGTNYGIGFSNNSLGLIEFGAGGTGNFTNAPSGDTVLFFLSGGAATMNVAGGFDTGFSFYYASTVAGFINVYDGLNATGNVLATLNLSATPNPWNEWSPIGVSFSGIAKSVDFGGTVNQVAFDNITLGAAIPGGGGVPEPATWAMLITGFGAIGAAMRVRRRKVTFASA